MRPSSRRLMLGHSPSNHGRLVQQGWLEQWLVLALPVLVDLHEVTQQPLARRTL